MDFFPPPRARDEELAERPERVPWQDVPEAVLGGIVPLERILVRNDHLVIAATEAVAYQDGVELRLLLRARRRPGMSRRQWVEISRGMWGDDVYSWDEDAERTPGRYPDALLRFGVRFADGTTATTVDADAEPEPGVWPPPRPDGPVLVLNDGGGSGAEDSIESERSLWLWPLPPEEAFELAVEWPLLGVDLTFVPLDGAAIREASRRARPFWDD
ncbi:hypothetical protein [Streptomyces sp. NPDC003077]|uniref:hypothetical protein n=1 Tax=Streptomyces sp. NPDC003077 TaxID=3154443 RepID=UPI0033A5EE17